MAVTPTQLYCLQNDRLIWQAFVELVAQIKQRQKLIFSLPINYHILS